MAISQFSLILIGIFAAFTFVGCDMSTSRCDNKATMGGYVPVYVNSSNYKIGQVVAVYTRPKKIDILIDPGAMPAGQLLDSPTVQYKKEELEKYEAKLSGNIASAVKADVNASSQSFISVSIDNARAIEASHGNIYEFVESFVSSHPAQRDLANRRFKDGVKIDIITHLLVGNISVTVNKDVAAGLGVSVNDIEKNLSAEFGGSFQKKSDATYSGSNVTIGYQMDSSLAKEVVNGIVLQLK